MVIVYSRDTSATNYRLEATPLSELIIIIRRMIETEQKLIQIGSSEGITLSKKDLARLGAKRGDLLHIKVELANRPSNTKNC